jgi:3-oxoacyl-[acyl-carrier protein] reductase
MVTRVNDLPGRRALVCGASSGIGRASAMALADRGARVIALARREDLLVELVDEINAMHPGEAGYVVADLDDRLALQGVIDSLLAEGGPIHVLVNNTGGPPPGRLLDADPEDLQAGFSRHVLAAHLLITRLVPGMRESGFGRIVNIISTSVREPIPGLGVSNTIRAAMAGLSKTISNELPMGVTINNVLPGYTDTARLQSLSEAIATRNGKTPEEVRKGWVADVPEGRLGRPEEIAAAVAFLASPDAGYIRGQSLAVDGGRMKSI